MKLKPITIPQLLLFITLSTSLAVFIFLKPIAQDISYHDFANDNAVFGIANFWNVISNIGFIIAGVIGLCFSKRNNIVNPMIWILFAAVILTGFGSAYYHFMPNNSRLVLDRLPMTIVFTSFFALIYSWCYTAKTGFLIWLFSLSVGIYAVFYWQYTEHAYRGDLRLYAIVQFLPIILIGIILASNFKKHDYLVKPIAMIVLWYVAAKLLEHFDYAIFTATNFIGGHPLKHLAAAIASFYMYKMLKVQYAVQKKFENSTIL